MYRVLNIADQSEILSGRVKELESSHFQLSLQLTELAALPEHEEVQRQIENTRAGLDAIERRLEALYALVPSPPEPQEEKTEGSAS